MLLLSVLWINLGFLERGVLALYASTSISTGMKGATKATMAMNKQMEPAKQAKVVREFQKQSPQMDMTIEMMSESIDETLDKDEAEEETEELTNQDLRRKLETNKKSKKSKNVVLETIEEQLLEAEEMTIQLINLNGQMTRKIEDIPVSKDGQRSIDLEKATSFQKKIQNRREKRQRRLEDCSWRVKKSTMPCCQLEDGMKNKVINRFSRTKSRTTVILPDFIHSGRRSSVRKDFGHLCVCFKPSSKNAGGNM